MVKREGAMHDTIHEPEWSLRFISLHCVLQRGCEEKEEAMVTRCGCGCLLSNHNNRTQLYVKRQNLQTLSNNPTCPRLSPFRCWMGFFRSRRNDNDNPCPFRLFFSFLGYTTTTYPAARRGTRRFRFDDCCSRYDMVG